MAKSENRSRRPFAAKPGERSPDTMRNEMGDTERAQTMREYGKSIGQGMLKDRDIPTTLGKKYKKAGEKASFFGKSLSEEERKEMSAGATDQVAELARTGRTTELAELKEELEEANIPTAVPEGTLAERQMLREGLKSVGRDPKTGERVVVDSAGNVRKRSDLLQEYPTVTDPNHEPLKNE